MKKKVIQHNNLRLLRIICGDFPQKYIADKIGVSQVAYSKMESGEITPSAKTIELLSLLYETNVEEVLYILPKEIKKRLLPTTKSSSLIPMLMPIVIPANQIKRIIKINAYKLKKGFEYSNIKE